MTQADQVVQVIQARNAPLTLGEIYHLVDVSTWRTRTPFASIRRIVQKDQRLAKIKPGLYCMRQQYQEYAEQYDERPSDEQAQCHNHALYQGLLLEMGLGQQMQTYVPAQDRGRAFPSGKILGDMANLDRLPNFGYDNHMREARTVDVVWINDRRMPQAFYEVEMTTYMGRSLEKFTELQDFHATICIVAPEARRGEFQSTIGRTAYKGIKGRVRFRTTTDIMKEHNNSATQWTAIAT